MGLFLIVNGFLLSFKPEEFLRFYDFCNRGDYVGKAGAWRRDVGNIQYKLLGLCVLFVGAAIIWGTLPMHVSWPR